jgi:hypothetical protein
MIKFPKNLSVPMPSILDDKNVLQVLEVAGNVGVASIKERVRSGRGVDDQKMKTKSREPNSKRTYSKKYAERRQRSGRRADVRDLSLSGQMLKAVLLDRVEKTDTGSQAVITVANDQKEKAVYNQALTPWFGVSPNDEQAIRAAVEAELQRIVSEA